MDNNIIRELQRVWEEFKNFYSLMVLPMEIKLLNNYREFFEEFRGLDSLTNILIDEKSLVDLKVSKRVYNFF